jgi:hypothetical protein
MSTIALHIVEDNKRGTQCLGYNWGSLSLKDINIGTRASMLGVGCGAVDLAV